jgi:ankyrin repeat protein
VIDGWHVNVICFHVLLIETHPDGLHFQDNYGRIPLSYALEHPFIDCFRSVLYNGNAEATTIQNEDGWTPLHYRIAQSQMFVSLQCGN